MQSSRVSHPLVPAIIHFAPTLGWLAFMVLPFALTYVYLDATVRNTQAIGIGIFLSTTILTDTIARRSDRLSPTKDAQQGKKISVPLHYIERVFLAIFLIIPIIHIYIAGKIPVLHLFDNINHLTLIQQRENFSKLLDAPYLLKIAFTQEITVLAPVLFSCFVIRRNYYLALFVLVYGTAYALASMAKIPVLLLTLTAFSIIAARREWLHWKRLPACIFVLLCLSCIGSVFRVHDLMSYFHQVQEEKRINESFLAGSLLTITPSDVERIELREGDKGFGKRPPPTFGHAPDYIIYRALLTPVDVSNRWYRYFSDFSAQMRDISELTKFRRPPNWQHPSNAVGRWAYVSRFPAKYQQSVSAYASIDADAFSFGGMRGVMITAFLYGLARLALAFLDQNSPRAQHIYIISILILTVFPAQSSLQAILVPQGLLTLVVFMLALSFIRDSNNSEQ